MPNGILQKNHIYAGIKAAPAGKADTEVNRMEQKPTDRPPLTRPPEPDGWMEELDLSRADILDMLRKW